MKTSLTLSQGSFNTLAQNGTGNVLIVQGKGSELSNNKALKGRAKRKMITQKTVLNLIDVEKSKNGVTPKGYWNTYHCQSKVYTANGRLYGKYCKIDFVPCVAAFVKPI